jgi:hypothetical protein
VKRDKCLALANLIEQCSINLGKIGPCQIYKGTSNEPPSIEAARDREKYDLAMDRSDHAPFQDHGYPSIVVTEDFFINLSGESQTDANPNYHKNTDISEETDINFASDICSVVCLAAKLLARD